MSLSNSLRVRGVGGTLQLAWRRFRDKDGTPAYILSRTLDLERFDREHHVETAGLIELDELEISSPSKKHGVRYGGASPWIFKDLMARLPIDHSKYTFIDIGSGKGAALFQASDYPFREIIGVEFSLQLHQAALRNLRSFRSNTQRCTKITPICEDASAYEYPPGPWVLFFNSPFDVPLWKLTADNIARCAEGHPGSYLIHMNRGFVPGTPEFVESIPFLRRIYCDDVSAIFECIPVPGAPA